MILHITINHHLAREFSRESIDGLVRTPHEVRYLEQGLSSGNAMDFIGNGNMYSKFWGKVNGFRESVLVGDKTEERKRYFDARRFFREFDFQEGIVGLLNYVGREPNNLGVIDCYIQLMIAYQRKDAGKMVELKGKMERLIERRV